MSNDPNLIAKYVGAYVLAAVFSLLVVVLYSMGAKGLGQGAGIIDGADQRPSTSKFQFWLWTVAIVFGYTAIYFARLLRHGFPYAIDEIPGNLLLVMGFSGVTTAAAKGITSSFVSSGQLTKPPADASTGPARWRCLLVDDQGKPDLGKVQILTWTFLALTIFLIAVVNQVHWIMEKAPLLTLSTAQKHVARIGLPDISPALMVLMGLAQGAYLGTKLVSTETPRITGVDPPRGLPGTTVTVNGLAFGTATEPHILTLNGRIFDKLSVTAKPGVVSFAFPVTQSDGTPWPAGPVAIGLRFAGQQSANEFPFEVLHPTLLDLNPTAGKPGQQVNARGAAWGTANHARVLLIDGTAYPAVSVTPSADPQSVQFPFPAMQADGTAWTPKQVQISFEVSATSGGYKVQTAAKSFDVK